METTGIPAPCFDDLFFIMSSKFRSRAVSFERDAKM